MSTLCKLTKSGSITIEEANIIKSEAEKVLISAQIANQNRTKIVRIDHKTIILVKPNTKNAREKYLEKQRKYVPTR